MHGRSCIYLLAVGLLPVPLLCGQSDHAQSSFSDSLPASTFASLPPDATRVARSHDTAHGGPPPHPIFGRDSFGFAQLADAAGTIFSGTVARVARHPASHDFAGHEFANHNPANHEPVDHDHTIETVSITFHVERAVRGATPGQDLTISQWVALWAAGQRYRVGERVLLFLYPPSKLGLTSSVAGPIGRFAIDALDRVTPSEQQLPVLRTEPLLSGKSHLNFSDFAGAVRASAQPRPQPSAQQ